MPAPDNVIYDPRFSSVNTSAQLPLAVVPDQPTNAQQIEALKFRPKSSPSSTVQPPSSYNPNSIGSQLTNGIGSSAGTIAGAKASEALTGTSGIGQTIGSYIGGYIGGTEGAVAGAAFGGIGAPVGAAAGAFIGSTVGGSLGKVADDIAGAVGNLFNPSNSNPSASNPSGSNPSNSSANQAASNAENRYQQAKKAAQDSQRANPANDKGANSGNSSNYKPDFSGGQDVGVVYYVQVAVKLETATQYLWTTGTPRFNDDTASPNSTAVLLGAIRGLTYTRASNGWNCQIRGSSDRVVEFFISNFGQFINQDPFIYRIRRFDGLPDTSGDPKDPSGKPTKENNPFKPNNNNNSTDDPKSPNYFPYRPTVKVSPQAAKAYAPPPLPFKEPDKPKVEPDKPKASPSSPSPLGNSNPAYATPPSGNPTSSPSSSPAKKPPNRGEKPAYESPAYESPAFASKPYVSGESNPADYGKQIDNGTGKERVITTPENPNGLPVKQNPLTNPLAPSSAPSSPPSTNPSVDPNTLLVLGGLAGIAATVTANRQQISQIFSQTTAASQRANAAAGSCDTLQTDSCTLPFRRSITEPIAADAAANQAVNDAKQNLIIGNQAAQDGVLASIQASLKSNFDSVKKFLDNTIVDRAIGAANFAIGVHNALMLSNNLGKTLASVVDTGASLAQFKFTDTAGNATTATRFFSQGISSLIINTIGQENYTELTNDWKVANRIYQSSTSLLNKTERLLGAQSKVAQKGNIDVANIGNALRANGVVNPNSYPPMAATKEANTPPEVLADVNSPLASFGATVRNLNTITKSVNSTLRNVSGIQKDFGRLADLTNGESKVRKSIRTQSANEAKRKAKFTFIQIKQIKSTTKK